MQHNNDEFTRAGVSSTVVSATSAWDLCLYLVAVNRVGTGKECTGVRMNSIPAGSKMYGI